VSVCSLTIPFRCSRIEEILIEEEDMRTGWFSLAVLFDDPKIYLLLASVLLGSNSSVHKRIQL